MKCRNNSRSDLSPHMICFLAYEQSTPFIEWTAKNCFGTPFNAQVHINDMNHIYIGYRLVRVARILSLFVCSKIAYGPGIVSFVIAGIHMEKMKMNDVI